VGAGGGRRLRSRSEERVGREGGRNDRFSKYHWAIQTVNWWYERAGEGILCPFVEPCTTVDVFMLMFSYL